MTRLVVVPRTPEEIDDMLLDGLIDCQKNGRYVRLGGEVREAALRLVERGLAQQDPGGDAVFIATPDGFRAKDRLDEYTFHVPNDVQMAVRLAHESGAGVGETLAALRSLAFVQAVLSGDVAEALNMKTHVELFSRPGMP